MSNFIPPSTITANGSYEINTRPGREHLMTIKGTFGSGTVTMTAYDDASGTYVAVDNGTWTANAEPRFYAPSGSIRLTLTGATAPSIGISVTPISKGR